MSLPEIQKEIASDSSVVEDDIKSIYAEKDVERAAAEATMDWFPRTDTDRFPHSETVKFNQDEEAKKAAIISGAGIGLPRTLTLERPRYAQKNKVIGDFRTLSIQLSEGGLHSDTHRAKKGQKKSLRGE